MNQQVQHCPFCSAHTQMNISYSNIDQSRGFTRISNCPICSKYFLHLCQKGELVNNFQNDIVPHFEKNEGGEPKESDYILIFPKTRLILIPDGVPASIAKDFNEAVQVRDISSNASGVLIRRCLQVFLKEKFDYTDWNLKDSVKKYVNDTNEPKNLRELVDVLRWNGNTGAHAEDDAGFEEVSADEVEATIDVLTHLFQHYYGSQPKVQSAIDRIKNKLKASGRNVIEPAQGDIS